MEEAGERGGGEMSLAKFCSIARNTRNTIQDVSTMIATPKEEEDISLELIISTLVWKWLIIKY